MKYFVSSYGFEQAQMTLSEVLAVLDDIEEQEFIAIERENLTHPDIRDYVQTTINTYDEHLFWLEARQYHSNDLNDYTHYRRKINDVQPIIQAFTAFMTWKENYTTWEDVTNEYKYPHLHLQDNQ